MNYSTFHRAAQFACALSSILVLSACSSGGDDAPPATTPSPDGYVVAVTRVDARMLEVSLSRTLDEPALGLQCDLVFPPEFGIVEVYDPIKQSLLDEGFVAVGRDDADPWRVKVAAGQPGSDAVRGVGDLLTFRVRFSTDLPVQTAPKLEGVRIFHRSDLGDFAVDTATTRQWTIVQAQ